MNDSKAVLITGASSGIGEACALHLDKLGFTVFAGVRRSVDGERLKKNASARLIPVMLDVVSESSIEASVVLIRESLGDRKLWGIVNNAGVVVAGPLELLSSAHLREQLEVNVIGLMSIVRAFIPMLRESGGRIVNMSSVSGKLANPFVGAYCASKFAVEALSDTLRLELSPWGIGVSLIEPGVVATPIWHRSSDSSRARIGQDPRLKSLYGKLAEAAVKMVEEAEGKAIAPLKVAEAVGRALTARQPKTRYVVGNDARIGIFLARCLPARWMDALIRSQLKKL